MKHFVAALDAGRIHFAELNCDLHDDSDFSFYIDNEIFALEILADQSCLWIMFILKIKPDT